MSTLSYETLAAVKLTGVCVRSCPNFGQWRQPVIRACARVGWVQRVAWMSNRAVFPPCRYTGAHICTDEYMAANGLDQDAVNTLELDQCRPV